MLKEKLDMVKEKILCSAIDHNGVIVCGQRHSDCYSVLMKLTGLVDAVDLPDRTKQGFLTSKNRYVSRAEGWKIAKGNNQIVFGLDVSDGEQSQLISENLY